MFMLRRPLASHIVSVVQTLDGGGVERALLRMSRDWSAAGRRVTIVTGLARGPLLREVPPGIELIELGRADYLGLAALPGLLRRLDADLFFCPGNHYSSLAALTRLRLGRDTPPILAKISNALVRRDQRFPVAQGYRLWLRQHPSFIDHFVAMTEAMRIETVAMTGADLLRVSVIANPPPMLRAHGHDRPVAIDVPGGPLLVGVGRLEVQKRWDRAIAALSRLHDRTARLVILGEGSQRAVLEAQVGALGLTGRVLMPGHVPDPAPYIARARAVVLTSDYEGVPGVLSEALALGTPVVATESSFAVREIIASPDLGSIVMPDDEQALVAALSHWLSPASIRPKPVPLPGAGSSAAYLALFDRMIAQRQGVFVR